MFSVFLLLLSSLVGHEAILVHSQAYQWNLNFTYHKYNDLTVILRQICHFFPELASLYSIGKSAKKRELWVLKITSPESSILGSPNIKYVGNIHGNEPVGRELILHLAEYLVKNYQTNEEVRWLLDKTIIHLLPSLNPDGFEESIEGDCDSITGRGNGNLIDLNRSFPDFFKDNFVPRQPETEAVISWLSKIPFVLSASFHGGSLVANYPYENDAETGDESLLPRYSSSPDDDTFIYLAEVYAKNHLKMHKGTGCQDESSFPGGITNGAAWYKITGGMQDYNYIKHGCMELTLEVSCCKYPSSHNLHSLWNDNLKAILELGKRSHLGVRGIVMDSMTGIGISGAILSILGRNVNFTSHTAGEFWRILLPGNYILRAEANGYQIQMFPFTVRDSNESFPEPTWLNIYLRPENLTEIEASKSGAPSLHHNFYIILSTLLINGFIVSTFVRQII